MTPWPIGTPRGARDVATVGVLFAVSVATPLSGQENRWSGQTELGANLFFGNTEQTLVTMRGGIERADSTLEVSASLKFTYGEASDAEGNDFVNKRSWQVVAGADYRPFARVTPFFFGTLESSFESKIDERATGGADAKVVFVRDEARRVDVSLAILAERTVPLPVADTAVTSTTLARWSVRFRYRREWDEGNESGSTASRSIVRRSRSSRTSRWNPSGASRSSSPTGRTCDSRFWTDTTAGRTTGRQNEQRRPVDPEPRNDLLSSEGPQRAEVLSFRDRKRSRAACDHALRSRCPLAPRSGSGCTPPSGSRRSCRRPPRPICASPTEGSPAR